jgi:hypothetical protein
LQKACAAVNTKLLPLKLKIEARVWRDEPGRSSESSSVAQVVNLPKRLKPLVWPASLAS